jgi:hypothetical protein
MHGWKRSKEERNEHVDHIPPSGHPGHRSPVGDRPGHRPRPARRRLRHRVRCFLISWALAPTQALSVSVAEVETVREPSFVVHRPSGAGPPWLGGGVVLKVVAHLIQATSPRSIAFRTGDHLREGALPPRRDPVP